jgi:hypothetical protein
MARRIINLMTPSRVSSNLLGASRCILEQETLQ